MKRISWKMFGWLGFLLISVFFVYKKAFAQGVRFDPEGKIRKATKLPDKSPEEVIIATAQWALGFLGLVAVILIIYGGFTWMTSAGNEERVKKAKEIIKASVIGLVIVLASWMIVTFVIGRVNSTT